METRVLPFTDDAIIEAARLILSGEPVAVPTETVYGLAADATNGAAVARVYEAKGRPAFNPLIVHVSDLASAERIGAFSAEARELAHAHWPGPLTLVVTLREDARIASIVTAGLPTVGIRMPNHPLALALIEAAGVPIAAPSANRFMGLSPTTAEHVPDALAEFILDGGPASVGIESTVLSLVGAPVLLRPGVIPLTEIEALINEKGLHFGMDLSKFKIED